jgi:hypothetical protein
MSRDDDPPRDRPPLHLVQPAVDSRLGGVPVIVAATRRPPFPVVEDDTFSVLGADPTVREPTDHPIRIWTGLKDVTEAEPGTVIVRPGRPLRFLAVVHDLARSPTWTEDWVDRALAAALRELARRNLTSIGLPPLGGVHGRLTERRFVELLRGALEDRGPDRLERIWIVAAGSAACSLRAALAADSDGHYIPST